MNFPPYNHTVVASFKVLLSVV